jgi:hypothetical protein
LQEGSLAMAQRVLVRMTAFAPKENLRFFVTFKRETGNNVVRIFSVSSRTALRIMTVNFDSNQYGVKLYAI